MTKEESKRFEDMADGISDDVGATLGSVVGGAVGGPVGAAVGGVIGDAIGGAVGGDGVEKAAEAVNANAVLTTGSAADFYQNQMFQLSVQAAAGWLSINQSIVAKVSESILSMDMSSPDAVMRTQELLNLVKQAQDNSKPQL